MTTTRTLGILATVAGVLAFAVPAGAQQAGDVARGAEEYGATCGRCHNPRSPVERSDRDWVIIVNHMRARAGLTGQQVRDILAFLQAMNHDEPIVMTQSAAAPTIGGEISVSSDPAVIAKGKALTTEKGCVGCHAIAGTGGQIGPDLDGVIQRRGVDFVVNKLTNPAFDNPGTLMPNLNLSKEEIEALVAYLATLR